MNGSLPSIARRTAHQHWWAWVALCGALAAHVVDEAFTNFLGVYNPTVVEIRKRLPWLPLPTFTFQTWLSGLIVAVVVLLVLSVFVWKGKWWMRPLSYIFAGSMLMNGLLHVGASVYMSRLMPGVYSSPLLLVASVVLIVCTRSQKYFSLAA